MKEESKLAFYEQLSSVLQGLVEDKSKETREILNFCDALKSRITRDVEEAYKLDIFADGFDLRSFIAQNIEMPIARLKEQTDKPWLKEKITIGLMGRFSTGKTTALNLIFDQKFPVHCKENTALPTYLVYGLRTDNLVLVDKSGSSQVIDDSQSTIFDYRESKRMGVKNFSFARIFDYFVKESPNAILKQLTFIDTPGLLKNEQHSEPTIKAVSTCDVYFWFWKATKGTVTPEELDFISTYLRNSEVPNNKPIYLVVSFIDAVDSPEKNIRIAKDTLSENGIDISGCFLLGDSLSIKSKFKADVARTLQEIVNEIKVYEPMTLIYAFLSWFEDNLTGVQRRIEEAFNKLDSDTDGIAKTYTNSQNRYASAHKNCVNRMNNMIDTFNRRCSDATFCGGASGAMARDINSVVESLGNMAEAYTAIGFDKLIEYGQLVGSMRELQGKKDRIIEIIADIKSIKSAFED